MKCTPLPVAPRGHARVPCHGTAFEWLEIDGDPHAATARISRFTGADGVGECHITVALIADAADPVAALESAWHGALDAAAVEPAQTVMRRVFCSDVVNQARQLRRFAGACPGAFSCIGQAPLGGGKFALWSQHVIDPDAPLETAGGGACFSLARGPLNHCWISGLCDTAGGDAFSQTMAVLENHGRWLADHHMTLARNVVRTWWFVRDIGADYQGLVDARREVFAQHGLTENTHYIASTGIAGTHHEPAARLSLDSYAIAGLEPAQIEYPSAPQHLGPTHAYGVTFERAAAISYADRRHVFISGTASIDADGQIVHPGDVLRQLDRTLENISALLEAAGASFDDLAMVLVYLRDPADVARVGQALERRFGTLPMLLLHAPVCRPGWLIEIEGVAIVASHEPGLPDF